MQNVEEQEIVCKDFLERFGPYIHKMLTKDEFLMTLMKLRLHFLFIDLS